MELAHRREGQGRSVLVLRQLDPPEFWAGTTRRLSGSCDVVTVDLPGFGRTPPLADGRTSVPALAEAVAAWVPGARLDRPVIVGNSLGGAVALEVARRGAVTGAVAVSPIGFWSVEEAARALRSLAVGAAVARALGPGRSLLAAAPLGRAVALGQLVARPHAVPRPTARAALDGMVAAPAFAATRREARGYAFVGAEPSVPVTVAWGARDRMTPPHQAERARERLPNARHVTLPGCGHAAMVDDPDAVAEVVLAALRDTDTDGGRSA